MQLRTPAGTVFGEEVLTALSTALFCTLLEPRDMPGEDRIRREVLHVLGTDLAGWSRRQVVRTEADNPQRYASRMSWCRQMVLLVFFRAAPPT